MWFNDEIGFGGKLEIGESVEECAKRELTEECGLKMIVIIVCTLGNCIFHL